MFREEDIQPISGEICSYLISPGISSASGKFSVVILASFPERHR
jgi:hypothetical protein